MVGFTKNVRQGISYFLATYHAYFSEEDKKYILGSAKDDEPSDVLNRLWECTKNAHALGRFPHKIYLLVDEYDHFANELLAFRLRDFKSSVGQNGFVRKFYESIKAATGEGIVDRIFITGVSPVTLDSLTSGFNIGTHLTLELPFHDMMGFNEQEVATILSGIGIETTTLPAVIADLRAWYNGYLFNSDAQVRLYNPGMVLSFATKFSRMGKYPKELHEKLRALTDLLLGSWSLSASRRRWCKLWRQRRRKEFSLAYDHEASPPSSTIKQRISG